MTSKILVIAMMLSRRTVSGGKEGKERVCENKVS